MQSTGQGGTHRSQPVHSSANDRVHLLRPRRRSRRRDTPACTACSRCRRCSSITASGRGRSTPFSGLSGITGLPSRRGEPRDAFDPAGRALVVACIACRDGFGVGAARGIAALGALRLGQQIFDAVCERLRSGCGHVHGLGWRHRRSCDRQGATTRHRRAHVSTPRGAARVHAPALGLKAPLSPNSLSFPIANRQSMCA